MPGNNEDKTSGGYGWVSGLCRRVRDVCWGKRGREEGDEEGSCSKRRRLGEEEHEDNDEDANRSPIHQEENVQEDYFQFPFLTDPASLLSLQSSLTMIILRGLPGSGKSSLAARILETCSQGQVCSADDYFRVQDGTYR